MSKSNIDDTEEAVLRRIIRYTNAIELEKASLDQLVAAVRKLPKSAARDAALERAGYWVDGSWVARSCGQGWETPFVELRRLLLA